MLLNVLLHNGYEIQNLKENTSTEEILFPNKNKNSFFAILKIVLEGIKFVLGLSQVQRKGKLYACQNKVQKSHFSIYH